VFVQELVEFVARVPKLNYMAFASTNLEYLIRFDTQGSFSFKPINGFIDFVDIAFTENDFGENSEF
jgi:hypothetical protein